MIKIVEIFIEKVSNTGLVTIKFSEKLEWDGALWNVPFYTLLEVKVLSEDKKQLNALRGYSLKFANARQLDF